MKADNRSGISIVMCCYNSEKRLEKTLQHIIKQDYTGDCELVVVNNASTDSTVEFVENFWKNLLSKILLTIVNENNAGLIHARKTGIRNAKYNLIVFVDDDNWLDKSYLKIANQIFETNKNLAAIGGQGTPKFEKKPPNWFFRFESYFALGKPPSAFHSEVGLFGAGLSIRKDLYLSVIHHGFESILTGRKGNNLTSGEDFELCKAFVLYGYKVQYIKDLKFIHQIPASRISFNYIKKLNKGMGKAYPYLLLYELKIRRMQKKGFLSFLKTKWSFLLMWHILRFLFIVFKLLIIWILKKDTKIIIAELWKNNSIILELLVEFRNFKSLKIKLKAIDNVIREY